VFAKCELNPTPGPRPWPCPNQPFVEGGSTIEYEDKSELDDDPEDEEYG